MLNFKKDIAKIGGWLTEAEGIFLYQTAKEVDRGNAIVEIGSWKGRSTICLGRGTQDGNGAEIFAVDPHSGSFEHKRVLHRLLQTMRP